MKKLLHYLSWTVVIALLCPGKAEAQTPTPVPWVFNSVKSYGAKGTGTDDDTLAINQTIAAGTAVYFPPGIYKYKGRIGLTTGSSYRFFGDGPGVSIILFEIDPMSNPPNVSGISGQFLTSLDVDHLTIKANSQNIASPAIDALFGPVGKFRTANIHDVQIVGDTRNDSPNYYWPGAIHLRNAPVTVIDKVEISGRKDNSTGYGILFDAGSCSGATGFTLSNLQIKYCNTALRASNHIEGIYLTQFEFTGCGYGVGGGIAVQLGMSGFFQGVCHLANGKIESYATGVDVSCFLEAKISNVYFKHPDAGTTTGTSLARISYVNDAMVTECSFDGSGGNLSVEHGVQLDNSAWVRIDGNRFSNNHSIFGYGISVSGNSSIVRITDNLFVGVDRSYPTPLPPSVFVRGNYP